MIVIISCGASKRSVRAPAWKLYTGTYFKSMFSCARKWASRREDIYILSAKYGLVQMDRVLPPYDTRIASPDAVTIQEVRDQAEQFGLMDSQDIILLGGKDYVSVLKAVFPSAKAPLQDMKIGGMGKQMQVMKRWAR